MTVPEGGGGGGGGNVTYPTVASPSPALLVLLPPTATNATGNETATITGAPEVNTNNTAAVPEASPSPSPSPATPPAVVLVPGTVKVPSINRTGVQAPEVVRNGTALAEAALNGTVTPEVQVRGTCVGPACKERGRRAQLKHSAAQHSMGTCTPGVLPLALLVPVYRM